MRQTTKTYSGNGERREGPFITKLKSRGTYKAFVEKIFYIEGKKKDYKDPSKELDDFYLRIKFRVDGFPEDDQQYADWFVISTEIPKENETINAKASRKLRGKNLFDALNMRKDGKCLIREKFGGCTVESQEDCDTLLDFIRNEPLTLYLDKHKEPKADGSVYPNVSDVDVLEDKQAPF